MEHLRHEGNSHSSSDLLKIFVKMGASWSAQVLRQAGDTLSGPGAFLLLFFLKTWRGRAGLLEVLMVVWRGVQGGVGCFTKYTVKLIKIVCKLLILQSAGGWSLVIRNVFQAFPR